MYKNIICFFLFLLLPEMYVWVEWESQRQLNLHTHRGRLYRSSVNFFSLFSTFVRVVQGHLKASNHLSFSSLLNPGQSSTNPEWCDILLLPSASLLWSPFVSAGYIIFWMPMQILVVIPPVCCLCIACGYGSFLHATHPIYMALPLRNTYVCLL